MFVFRLYPIFSFPFELYLTLLLNQYLFSEAFVDSSLSSTLIFSFIPLIMIMRCYCARSWWWCIVVVYAVRTTFRTSQFTVCGLRFCMITMSSGRGINQLRVMKGSMYLKMVMISCHMDQDTSICQKQRCNANQPRSCAYLILVDTVSNI